MGRGLKLLVGTLTFLCACSEPIELTQTVIFIDAEPAARATLASIEVQAIGPTDRREPAVEAKEPHWPIKLVLMPKNGDATRRFTLNVDARDADDEVLAKFRIKSGFVAHQSRYARVIIRDTCVEPAASSCSEDDAECGVWMLELDPDDFGRSESGSKTWRANCKGQGVEPPEPGETKPGDAGRGGDTATAGGAGTPANVSGSGGTAGGPPSVGTSTNNQTTCPSGFIASAGACVDLDECETFAKCPEHGRCENQPGTFRCVCDPGFQDASGTCTDIDECQTANGGCEGTCTNSIGSVTCACPTGEWLKVDQKTCAHIEAARQISLGGSTIPMEPRIAFDGNGNGLAVMTYADSNMATSLWIRRFVAGTGWANAPTRVTIEAGGVPSSPRVALDAMGRGVVMWVQTADSHSDVWAARYDGTTLGAAAKLEDDDSGSTYDPAIRLNGNGDGFATWTQSDGQHARIWVNRVRPGVAWSGAVPISSTNGEEAFAARIAVDDVGNASLVWTQTLVSDTETESKFTPWSASFDAAAGRWRLPAPLDDTGSAGFADTQLFGVEGNSLVVWPRNVDGRVSIVSRTFAPATGWADTIPVASDTSEFGSVLPSVSLSATGHGGVVWTQTQGSAVRVVGSRYDGSMGSWSEVTPLRMRNGATAPFPQIAVDPSGSGLAVWSEIAGTSRAIWLWRLQAGSGFAEGAQLRTDETASPPANSTPQVAVDPHGNGMAIWDVHNAGTYTVWAARFE